MRIASIKPLGNARYMVFFETLAMRKIDLRPFLRDNRDNPAIGRYAENLQLLDDSVFVDECGAFCAGDKLARRIDFDINPKAIYNGEFKD